MSETTATPTTTPRPRERGAGKRSWLDRLQHRLHLQDLLADAAVSRGIDAIRQSQRGVTRWFMVSAIMGFTIGLATAGIAWVVEESALVRLHEGHRAWWFWLLLPGFGLAITRGILLLAARWDLGGDVETTEAYIGMFHARSGRLRIRDLWAKILATIATIGTGGSLGLEGPGVLVGGTVGAHTQTRMARLFAGEEAKLLMVAGAAAGVSAVFRAPVTGLVFALEVPFKDDMARHAVLPAIVASATGYLGQAVIFGTSPLFPVAAVPGFSGVDLFATLGVGLACGIGAHVFARLLRASVARTREWPWHRRWMVGASAVGFAGAVSAQLFGQPDAIGLGYEAILRVIPAADPATSGPYAAAWTLGVLLGLKVVAIIGTIVAGGVGGVFTSLVLLGATIGSLSTRGLAPLFPSLDTALFPLVGMAAFLGAGYHVPLAAVVFVAETTGSANYIVAGLLAAAVAFGTMGRQSVSSHQRSARRGRIEQLLDVPVSTAIRAEPIMVDPTCSIEDFVNDYVVRYRHREYPVTDKGRLVGMIALDDAGKLPHETWNDHTVAEVMLTDPPRLGRNASLTEAAELMAREGRDRIPVVDDLDRVIGMVGPGDVFRLGEVLEDISRSRG